MVQEAPADALLGVAKDVDATLIVVGSQGMAGARRLLGSVPNKVSHEARTNVLIVSNAQALTRAVWPSPARRWRCADLTAPRAHALLGEFIASP